MCYHSRRAFAGDLFYQEQLTRTVPEFRKKNTDASIVGRIQKALFVKLKRKEKKTK